MLVQLSARNRHCVSDDNFVTEYQIIKRQLPLPSVLYFGGNVTAVYVGASDSGPLAPISV